VYMYVCIYGVFVGVINEQFNMNLSQLP